MATKVASLVVGQDKKITKGKQRQFVDWLKNTDGSLTWFVLRKLFVRNKYFAGKKGLVLDTRHSIPLNPYEHYTEEELRELTNLDKSAPAALAMVEGEAERENKQNIVYRTVSLVIGSIFLLVVILVILVATGRLGGH